MGGSELDGQEGAVGADAVLVDVDVARVAGEGGRGDGSVACAGLAEEETDAVGAG